MCLGVHAPASQGQVSGIHRKNGLGLKTFAVLSVRICQHDRPERRGWGWAGREVSENQASDQDKGGPQECHPELSIPAEMWAQVSQYGVGLRSS